MKRRLVTSALPYINNVPHLGNLIQVLSADCFARFCRLKGYETLYICGTDEYGTATETRAAEEGISPQELCDRYYAIHAEIYRWFNIAFDKFGRTSTPIQTEIVQDIFKKLDAQGYIVERTIEQLHCATCGRFLADRYVRGICPHCGYEDARGDQCESCGKLLDPTELKDPRCSSCGSKPSLQSTKHLYIDLPAIKDRLEPWIKETSVRGFWANNAVQMTQAWIRDGLRERAITRDLKWGIPVPKPGYENKVFYVWFDAPIGYISITGNLGAERTSDWHKFTDHWWKKPDEVELFQFIGKDNIPFHTVIFPSSLLGTGENWTMLFHMSSTEYLNYESGKFSKSKGVGVFGTDVMETGIGADVWRFYIFYNRPEKSDALFTWKDFQEKVNGELIGNLGNLINRTLSFVSRYYDGKIPSGHDSLRDGEFWNTLREYESAIAQKLERAELRDAFKTIFELSSYANKRFQDGEPWKTRKEDPRKAEQLIHELCHVVRDIAVMIHPYMPTAAEKVASFFGLSIGSGGLSWMDIGEPRGIHSVVHSEVLFPKLEDSHILELRERYSGSQKDREERKSGGDAEKAVSEKAPKQETPAEPADQRFAKTINLRVAKIVNIERVPQAEKLFVIKLDIAGEERTIVSGLVPHYKEEDLLNKHIIVAYNLKKAKFRGIESHGMLLAASDTDSSGNERVEVLDAGDTPTGTRVVLEGVEPGETPEQIKIDTFFSIPITVENHAVMIEGKPLMIEGKPVKTSMIPTGEVG
ncbi:methionine--tRNA ligase [Breznakiella homolactica]|uniref:Methionine--tRNA ligase n=1 Tax=Breznakiella homolactica TaxID=2798577 RepID=A0A7T8B9H0_9SPIR|nr:methionine--tRNA ligase [Breznakiella homolactica]QQO07955.1 methionine--tRNA ligase [Breznakiella homolactica]